MLHFLQLAPFLLALLASVNSGPAISLKVSPRQGFAPVDAKVVVRVEKHEANRLLCVQVASDVGEEASSCQQLEGERARTVYEMWFKRLPPGNYSIVAYVLRAAEDAQFTPPESINVMGM